MENELLKTFTNSSLHGRRNSEMDKIMKGFRDECQSVLNKFINRCVRENIEYCSIDGALYAELYSMILDARLQARLDLDAEGIILHE